MNELSFTTSEENGLSIELCVDERPLAELIGAKDGAIPYWLFKNELPFFPPEVAPTNDTRIVGVCSCGEYGCAHTTCRVITERDTVVFKSFDGDVSGDGSAYECRFSFENYDSVIKEIIKVTTAFKEQ